MSFRAFYVGSFSSKPRFRESSIALHINKIDWHEYNTNLGKDIDDQGNGNGNNDIEGPEDKIRYQKRDIPGDKREIMLLIIVTWLGWGVQGPGLKADENETCSIFNFLSTELLLLLYFTKASNFSHLYFCTNLYLYLFKNPYDTPYQIEKICWEGDTHICLRFWFCRFVSKVIVVW